MRYLALAAGDGLAWGIFCASDCRRTVLQLYMRFCCGVFSMVITPTRSHQLPEPTTTVLVYNSSQHDPSSSAATCSCAATHMIMHLVPLGIFRTEHSMKILGLVVDDSVASNGTKECSLSRCGEYAAQRQP